MFCIAKGLEDLGTAKLLEADDQEAAIEFFDSPAVEGRITRTVASANVIRRTLGANTRIYHFDSDEYRWRVGRVLDDGDDDALIRFANKSDRVVSHTQLFVRWRRPISDPTVFLSHQVTETPQYADARSGFLSSYIEQRAAAGGISALLSSTIELETHQIRVVRRVLNDASQRHLLADEVGLGKTIEAGVIIRQAVLDDPKTHRIVVIAPASLIHQWHAELAKRFGLRDLIDDSVLIHSLQDTDAIEESLTGATMLVVDEAHHLTALGDESAVRTYAVVSRHARSVDRLLLLSATPALRNEVGFLRMLHLLDPVVYRLEDEAAFKSKIAHRQSLAEAVAFLNPQNVLSLDPVLDDLALKLPTDAQLQALITALRVQLMTFPDPEDPGLEHAILQLRAHLSETYRLHRRILRNRRKGLRFITPERRGSDSLTVQGWQARRIESMVEDWRLDALAHSSGNAASAGELADFYLGMVSAFVEDPRKLQPICDARLRTIAAEPGMFRFREEPLLLKRIRDSVADESWLRGRLDTLTDAVQKLVSNSKKVVVFCAEESTADAVSSHLMSSRIAAVRHSIDSDEEDSWRGFHSDTKVKVIVCGPTAEEGLNLQGGERAVVHFDLPLAPNRIEQRIGRVDRYGAGSTIRSTVLLDEGSGLQLGWYTLLDKGLGVFSRSIASLQYLLEDEFQRLTSVLFRNGSECFDILLAEYSGPDGKVTRELQLLDQQDALDELSPSADSHSEALEEADGDWRPIRKAVTHWAVGTLLFDQVLERDTVDIRAPDPPYRFRYQRPKSGPATLIPLAGFLYDFIGALDVEAPEASSQQPLSHKYSAHRKTAVARGARVLRYGDVFIEALKTFSDTDDRGRSFGIWRQHESGPETGFGLYFRFDFLVEAGLEEAERCLERIGLLNSAAARAAIRRRGDGHFAPTTIRIWITAEGEEVDPYLIEACLSLPYSKDPGMAAYTDTNLNPERLHALKEILPEIFVTWPERCAQMRERAQALVLGDTDLHARQAEALKQASHEGMLRAAQLTARIHSLQGAEADKEQAHLQLERDLNDALRAGIARPALKLDVVGFLMLSRQPCSALAGANEALA
jgi:ATP-dependent helicase HepA